MQGKKIYKKQWDEFLKTLEQMIGLISATCEKTGINRWTYYQHRRDNIEFAQEADNIMDQIGNPFTEDKLREAIFKGEGWAIKFYLQCKSKNWRPVEGREFPEGVKVDVGMKIESDPLLDKIVKAYEEELKNEIRNKNKTSKGKKPARLDNKRRNQKRKGKPN